MSQLQGVIAAAAVAVTAAALAVGCGGSDEPSTAAAANTGAFSPRSAEFTLLRRSEIGLRDASVTLTSRSDGKTDAIVDFYVPRTETARDDMYDVSIRHGNCSSLGETSTPLGDVSAGTTILLLDESFDETVEGFERATSSLVILTPDKSAVAWCGPSS